MFIDPSKHKRRECEQFLFISVYHSIYRGPSNGDSYELKYNGNSNRPHTNLGSSIHINPYLSKHGFYGPVNSKDRISIGGGELHKIIH